MKAILLLALAYAAVATLYGASVNQGQCTTQESTNFNETLWGTEDEAVRGISRQECCDLAYTRSRTSFVYRAGSVSQNAQEDAQSYCWTSTTVVSVASAAGLLVSPAGGYSVGTVN